MGAVPTFEAAMEVISELERREKSLAEVIQALIKAWERPGPMGTMMDMPRAISYARSILAEQQ